MFVNDVRSSFIECLILIYDLVFEITLTNRHLLTFQMCIIYSCSMAILEREYSETTSSLSLLYG